MNRRRVERRNTHRTARSSLPSVPGAGTPYAWWDADRNYTPDTGISTWGSRTNQHSLLQLTGAAQPTRNASSVHFNSLPSFSLTSAQGMACTLAASDWTFLHNGEGASIFIAQYLTDTAANVPVWTARGDVGIAPVQWDGAGGCFLRVYNGNASFYANEAAATMYNVAGVFGWRIQTGSVKYKIRGGAWTASTLTGSPSTDPPLFTLSMGAVGGSDPFIGEIAEIIIFDSYLDDTQSAAVYSYLATKYGW